MKPSPERLNQPRFDTVPFFELANVEQWFEGLCETHEIDNPVAVFSQIETWMYENALLSNVLVSYKHPGALKTFLARVMLAAVQAQSADKNQLYHRLERSPLFRQLYQLDTTTARSLLIFACSRPKGSNRIEERLEVETGRWGVHHFKRTPDNYFFRQHSDDFQAHIRRSNGILKNGTDQQPTGHQHEIIERRSLKQVGQLMIGRHTFEYDVAKADFEARLPEKNRLTLQAYATAAAQLETFCPEIYKYAESQAQLAAQTDELPLNRLYYLGTIMRVLYQAIRTTNATYNLAPEGEDIGLEFRLKDTLVKERLSSAHPPKTQREENRALWARIQQMKAHQMSPEAIFQQLSDTEKTQIRHEKLRALARSCGIHPAEERLI